MFSSFLHCLYFLFPFLDWLTCPLPFTMKVCFLFFFSFVLFVCLFVFESIGALLSLMKQRPGEIHIQFLLFVGSFPQLSKGSWPSVLLHVGVHTRRTRWLVDAFFAFERYLEVFFPKPVFPKKDVPVSYLEDSRLALGILGAVKALWGRHYWGRKLTLPPSTCWPPHTSQGPLCSACCPRVRMIAGSIPPENECPVP